MRLVSAQLARIGAAVALALVVLASPASHGRAAPPVQRDDRLDQPLLAANMCGAGDAGDIHLTIAATGDTFPHENIQAAGEAEGYDALFDHVRPFLKAADLAYTNFDGAMLEGSPYTGYPTFNYNPKLAAALHNAGIGLVSTANNHIMDRGPEGLDATLKVLEANGIAQHGTVSSAAAAEARPPFLPLTLTRDGRSIKIAFLSFSWGTNGIPDPYEQVNLLWQGNDYGSQGGVRQSVLDAIAKARAAADIVVVAAHWGFEYQFYPDTTQIEGAKQLAAAGADVILGAQSHTLQPVDILDTNGRKTLVIYSLANFLASQGAFQDQYYSATSTIFYVGLVRHADGSVGVTGYRYLPTIHVDGDTRPAPIPPAGYEGVIAHVRAEMRDFDGARQVDANPAALGPRVEICPSVALPNGSRIGGDFGQFFLAPGGTRPHPLAETLAVFGMPLGPPKRELAGDCRTTTAVLATERMRLELHPELDWPFRVVGTQLGVAAFEQKYGRSAIQRRTDIEGGAIGDGRFRAFFDTYGGLAAFGYPVSQLLTEADTTTGQPITVQYFERARFELVPGALPDAALPQQVRLGALVREYPGVAALCPDTAEAASATTLAPGPSPLPTAGEAAGVADRQPLATKPVAVAISGGRPWWLWPLIGLNALLLVGAGMWGLQIRADMQRRQARAERARRRAGATRRREPAPQPGLLADDELLRRLLDQ